MSDQPLNDAWGQGADGKWYPPEQLWGRAVAASLATPAPWGTPPTPEPPRAPRWPWLAVALGGLASFVLLAVIGAVVVDELDASARSAPSSTSELAGVSPSTSTSTTATSTTTTSTTPTTAAPTTAVAPPPPAPTTTVAPPPPAVATPPPVDAGVHYENCAAARAAGAAPVHRGQPGYARHLDRDDDGVGCE